MAKLLKGIVPPAWLEDITVNKDHIKLTYRAPIPVTGQNRSKFIETLNTISVDVKSELGDNVLDISMSADTSAEFTVFLRKGGDD